jgi:hypothetical protein
VAAILAIAGIGAAFVWEGPARQYLLLGGGLLGIASAVFALNALSAVRQALQEQERQAAEARAEVQRLRHDTVDRAAHFAVINDLASGLAHEIKNPLAGIAGVIDITSRDLPGGSSVREVLLEVQREIHRVKKILADLNDYARLKPPNLEPSDLKDTVEHAVSATRQQAAALSVEMELTAAADLPPVRHDTTQVQQVALHLLRNALQALNGAGKVRVQLETRDGFAVLSVSDNGPGIPPERLTDVFRPFYRLTGHGSGLGLAIARRIAEAHDGRLEASSKLGEGATFRLYLPLAR